MKKVAILGLGLMGASLGLAARRRRVAACVAGYARREATRAAALDGGIVHEVFADPAAAVQDAELVVLCVPILSMAPLASVCAKRLGPKAIVTDVGSTKAALQANMATALRGSRATFVGSHPIAGSDATGLEAARGDLYDGAVVVVTPAAAGSAAARARARQFVREFWSALGARVVEMDAAEHDRALARTSHLPHLVAAALVRAVLAGDRAALARLCGTGFRDTTRIAAGSEEMWHDVLRTNRDGIRAALDTFAGEIEQVRALLDAGRFDELRAYLGECRDLRQRCCGEPS